jgi:N-acylglucosamine-6-phosphate 2-epimerase
MFEKDNIFIVSCQAEGDDPFNSPEGVALFAKAAEMGGADGIRSEGVDKTRGIVSVVSIPVIGLVKSKFEDNSVRITGRFKDVEGLIATGCDIVAIDGTNRKRENLTGPEFISEVKRKYSCRVLADIATMEEAIACQHSGADFVSSTLNGYTPATIEYNNGLPNYDLVKELTSRLRIPVFAEGRISTPEQALDMINIGARGIVVGTSLTRPRIMTNRFINIINS